MYSIRLVVNEVTKMLHIDFNIYLLFKQLKIRNGGLFRVPMRRLLS